MLGSDSAVEGHAEWIVDHKVTEVFNALAVKSKLVVVKVNMAILLGD